MASANVKITLDEEEYEKTKEKLLELSEIADKIGAKYLYTEKDIFLIALFFMCVGVFLGVIVL